MSQSWFRPPWFRFLNGAGDRKINERRQPVVYSCRSCFVMFFRRCWLIILSGCKYGNKEHFLDYLYDKDVIYVAHLLRYVGKCGFGWRYLRAVRGWHRAPSHGWAMWPPRCIKCSKWSDSRNVISLCQIIRKLWFVEWWNCNITEVPSRDQ